MLPQFMAAMKGLAALPELVKAVNELGKNLNRVAANERLTDKRKRNRAAVAAAVSKRLPARGSSGQGGGANQPPSV